LVNFAYINCQKLFTYNTHNDLILKMASGNSQFRGDITLCNWPNND